MLNTQNKPLMKQIYLYSYWSFSTFIYHQACILSVCFFFPLMQVKILPIIINLLATHTNNLTFCLSVYTSSNLITYIIHHLFSIFPNFHFFLITITILITKASHSNITIYTITKFNTASLITYTTHNLILVNKTDCCTV